ncbi:NAD-dependent epimerase/dehydratase family protein [Alienimonas sp. DA493]|uniref:NAD-dependent epimerase/dehydratase family protein n=1 Tax=Alienimonas sp. DA493 TaxID=3373605 RepID=UPI0037543E30
MPTQSLLVTGGAGFIGSHVARRLLTREDCRVVVLDDLSGGSFDNLPDHPRLRKVEGSICDAPLVERLFREEQFRDVYHLAAYAAEGLSHFIRRFNYQNNVVGSMNLINESIRTGVRCFVFTSSIAVYGTGRVPLTEDMVPRPEDPYGVAKYAVELDLAAAKHVHDLDYVVFRPHNVYGEYQNTGDKYRNVVGIFMNQILRGEPMTIFGDGEQQRAFSYVEDILNPILAAPDTPAAFGRAFNIGADEPYSVNVLARQVAAAMGVPDHPVVHLPPRKEVVVAFSDHSNVYEVFGHQPQTALQAGLDRMAGWVREVGPRASREFEGIEVHANLPDSWRAVVAKEGQ